MAVRLEHIATVAPPRPGYGGTTSSDLEECASDLEKLYGPHADRTWLDDGERVSYADLVAAVHDHVRQELGLDREDAEPIDLVMTAHAVLDCQARVLPGCLLAERLGGRPLVLGVNDQGAAGPFTALRVVTNHLAGGQNRRACVVVMEQSTLPPEAAHPLPTRTGAVVLVLGASAGRELSELTIRRVTGASATSGLQRGFLDPWYDLAARHSERPGEELVVELRDNALGYDCRLGFSAEPATLVVPTDKTLEAQR